MDGPSMKSGQSGLQAERERCDREIAEFRRLLRAGHPDVEGVCRALVDWTVERRIIDGLERTGTETDGSASDGGEYVETRTAD
jgi:hypothetical protein